METQAVVARDRVAIEPREGWIRRVAARVRGPMPGDVRAPVRDPGTLSALTALDEEAVAHFDGSG
jgi:hypothetical protein